MYMDFIYMYDLPYLLLTLLSAWKQRKTQCCYYVLHRRKGLLDCLMQHNLLGHVDIYGTKTYCWFKQGSSRFFHIVVFGTWVCWCTFIMITPGIMRAKGKIERFIQSGKWPCKWNGYKTANTAYCYQYTMRVTWLNKDTYIYYNKSALKLLLHPQ